MKLDNPDETLTSYFEALQHEVESLDGLSFRETNQRPSRRIPAIVLVFVLVAVGSLTTWKLLESEPSRTNVRIASQNPPDPETASPSPTEPVSPTTASSSDGGVIRPGQIDDSPDTQLLQSLVELLPEGPWDDKLHSVNVMPGIPVDSSVDPGESGIPADPTVQITSSGWGYWRDESTLVSVNVTIMRGLPAEQQIDGLVTGARYGEVKRTGPNSAAGHSIGDLISMDAIGDDAVLEVLSKNLSQDEHDTLRSEAVRRAKAAN